MDLPELLTVNEVAAASRLTPKTIRNRLYRKNRSDRMPDPIRVDGELRFRRNEVVAWLNGESGEQEPTDATPNP